MRKSMSLNRLCILAFLVAPLLSNADPVSGYGATATAQPGQQGQSAPAPKHGAKPIKAKANDKSNADDQLIDEALDQSAPLTPEQIVKLRKELDRRAAALSMNVSGNPPPRPTMSVFQLDLSPRAEASPPFVRVSIAQGAVVSFLDATGKPWPIENADNYSKGFSVTRFSEHQLSVSLLNEGAMGNVSVKLEGLPTPVIFSTMSGQAVTDYSVQLIVPRYHGAVPSNVISQGSVPQLGSSDLFDYLLRTPPQGAVRLVVSGLPGAMAWQTSSSRMVVRTDALLTSAIRYFSLDGVTVYEVPLSPSVLGTLNGQYVQLRVSGFQAQVQAAGVPSTNLNATNVVSGNVATTGASN
jgi:intracellular multiplication protein IcmK